MTVRHYCTYFDHRYLPRGLAMMRSIRAFNPDARFYVLALDDTCKDIIDRLETPGITAIALSELEAADPELLATRQGRSLIEYYFTCTPCFPRYLFQRYGLDIDLLTYLDSDLLFFADPEIVFAEIGSASITITPHRFSPERVHLVKFGIYNVGWVSWRNDAEGWRCLQEYRKDCLDWCHDTLDGDRYGDQKYLDKWPQRYQGVQAIAHPGVNLAPWNINNHRLEFRDGRPFVSDQPVVFWHFHALKETAPGRWAASLDDNILSHNPELIPRIYQPYIDRLRTIETALTERYGFSRTHGPHIRYDANRPSAAPAAQPPAPASRPQVASQAYTIIDADIARAVTNEAWLHDDVADRQAAAYRNLLAAMKAGKVRLDLAVAAQAVRATGLTMPSLLEVGCGSGYYAEVFETLVKPNLRYTGLDYSEAMIALAQKTYPGRDFEVGDATALPYPDRSFDIVMNGVSLMHIMDYRKAISEARRVARHFVLFHTATLIDQRPTTYLRKDAYGRPTAEVIINEGEFRALLARDGMFVAGVWDSIPYNLKPVLGVPSYTRTFLCGLLDD